MVTWTEELVSLFTAAVLELLCKWATDELGFGMRLIIKSHDPSLLHEVIKLSLFYLFVFIYLIEWLTGTRLDQIVTQISLKSVQYFLRYFRQNHKYQPCGDARIKVRGSPKSQGFVVDMFNICDAYFGLTRVM